MKFPSPCGDMVLKCVRVLDPREVQMFPSPCGDMVLKWDNPVIFSATVSFPSPCGDMVLKCAGWTQLSEGVWIVSVPLRGYGFEISSTR